MPLLMHAVFWLERLLVFVVFILILFGITFGFLVFIYTLILAFFHAPIIHKNHPVSKKNKIKAKKKAIFFIVLESFIAIILYSSYKKLSTSIMTGFLTASLMATLSIVNEKTSRVLRL